MRTSNGWLRLSMLLAVASVASFTGVSTVGAEEGGGGGAGAGGDAGGVGVGGGTGGGDRAARREAFMKQFDANGDGKIDEEEQKAVDKYRADNPRQGRGGNTAGGFTRAPAVTADTLAAEVDKATEALGTEAALPETVKPEDTAAIKGKPVGFNLQDDTLGLWQATAKETDIARASAFGYNAAGLATKGILILQLPTPAPADAPAPAADGAPAAAPAGGAAGRGGMPTTPPSDALLAKAKVLTLPETADADALATAAKDAKSKKKMFAAGPSNALLTTWGDAKTGTVAKDCDYFLLNVQKWLDDDKTEAKTEFVTNVIKYSAAIRKANDKCKIFLEFGARDQGSTTGGGTAEAWVHAVALVNAKDGKSFDGVYIAPGRAFGGGRGGAAAPAAAPDPAKTGVNALKQFMAWVRPAAK